MKKMVGLLLVVALVFAVVALTVMRNRSAGEFHLENASGADIAQVTVRVSNKAFTFHDVAQRQVKMQRFHVGADSHYDISIEFKSGRKIRAELGYVTSGIEPRDRLIILDSQVRIEEKVE